MGFGGFVIELFVESIFQRFHRIEDGLSPSPMLSIEPLSLERIGVDEGREENPSEERRTTVRVVERGFRARSRDLLAIRGRWTPTSELRPPWHARREWLRQTTVADIPAGTCPDRATSRSTPKTNTCLQQ